MIRLAIEIMNDSPELKKWISSCHLTEEYIQSVRLSILSKPGVKYHVIDNFFTQKMASRLYKDIHQFRSSGRFDEHYYDANIGELGFHEKIFKSKSIVKYFKRLTGLSLSLTKRPDVAPLKVKKDSNGFWIHTDKNEVNNSQLSVLYYFNKSWSKNDGGLLQIWEEGRHHKRPQKFYSPLKYKGKKLNFLCKNRVLYSALPEKKIKSKKIFYLIDQIPPTYNRIVLLLSDTHGSYHSITPTLKRARYSITQWLF